MLFYYFYRERALTQNHTEYQHVTNDDNRQPKKTKTVNRTQEAIENMLILKVRRHRSPTWYAPLSLNVVMLQ